MPIPNSQTQRLSGEERHQLIAYREEIKKLKLKLAEEKEYYEGCNEERLEALNRAGIAEMELKILKREKPLPSKAIALLKDILKIKSPTIRRLKATIRQALDIVSSSADS